MRISHRYRFVFFAAPKTGSSTVRRFLNPYSDVRAMPDLASVTPDNPFHPHMPPREAKPWFDAFGWRFADYEKIVCVRNPWARLASLYRHIEREGPVDPFGDWLRQTLQSGPQATDDKLPWMRWGASRLDEFAASAEGTLLVDQVLRTEDIDTRLIPLLRALGLPIAEQTGPPKRHNTTGAGAHYRQLYSPDSAKWVGAHFAEEIDRFGYVF